MKKGMRLERFRLWKVKPQGIAIKDERRELLISLLTSATHYFDIDVQPTFHLTKTMSFIEALHILSEQCGLRVLSLPRTHLGLPIIAWDKQRDAVVLLLPDRNKRFVVVGADRETVLVDALSRRFDELVYLRPSLKPYATLSAMLTRLVTFVPWLFVIFASLIMATFLIASIIVSLMQGFPSSTNNHIVFVASAAILLVSFAWVYRYVVHRLDKNYKLCHLWLLDYVLRRYLNASSTSSTNNFATLEEGITKGIDKWFVLWPRLVFALFMTVFTASTLALFSTGLFLSFLLVTFAMIVPLGMLEYEQCEKHRLYLKQRSMLIDILQNYEHARMAIFGLGLTDVFAHRLFSAVKLVMGAHERLQQKKYVFDLLYVIIPSSFGIAALSIMSLTQTIDDKPHVFTMTLALSLVLGFMLVFLSEKAAKITNFGFEKSLTTAIEALPKETIEARVEPVHQQGSIELVSISFAHEDSGTVIFRDFTASIAAQDYVVIVGPSGSGKTTLLKILCGIFKPHKGEIIFDGQDARALNQTSLRQMFGVVFDNTDIFTGSIYNNILCGRTIPPEALKRLLLSHEVFDVLLDLPMALETYIFEHGRNLSRLQRTVILLARALVHGPKIVFFDDIAAGLSLADQAIVFDYLASLPLTRIVTSSVPSMPAQATKTIQLGEHKNELPKIYG